MIAKVTTGRNLKGTLDYHEKQVAEGKAQVIESQGIGLGKHPKEVTYAEKLGILQRMLDKKKGQSIEVTTFQVTLSFAPGEKVEEWNLSLIYDYYMEGMGYGRQPYLVYQLTNPDQLILHILSVTVDREGERIVNNFFKLKSEKLRRKLEKEFGLVEAGKAKMVPVEEIPLTDLLPVAYQKGTVKLSISRVVKTILAHYKATSLEELQVVLREYNVEVKQVRPAGSGKEKGEGLVYAILNSDGKRVSAGVHASKLDFPATLSALARIFRENTGARNQALVVAGQKVTSVVTTSEGLGWEDFKQRLAQAGIRAAGPSSTQEPVFFIDSNQRIVFRKEELSGGLTWPFFAGEIRISQAS